MYHLISIMKPECKLPPSTHHDPEYHQKTDNQKEQAVSAPPPASTPLAPHLSSQNLPPPHSSHRSRPRQNLDSLHIRALLAQPGPAPVTSPFLTGFKTPPPSYSNPYHHSRSPSSKSRYAQDKSPTSPTRFSRHHILPPQAAPPHIVTPCSTVRSLKILLASPATKPGNTMTGQIS